LPPFGIFNSSYYFDVQITLLYPFILSRGWVRSYWIGMRWEARKGRHIWIDNDVVTWTMWDRPPEPDCMSPSISSTPCSGTDIQNCVKLNVNFKFMTSNCTERYKVICQRGNMYFYRPFIKFYLWLLYTTIQTYYCWFLFVIMQRYGNVTDNNFINSR
jgi:hypothetical protein